LNWLTTNWKLNLLGCQFSASDEVGSPLVTLRTLHMSFVVNVRVVLLSILVGGLLLTPASNLDRFGLSVAARSEVEQGRVRREGTGGRLLPVDRLDRDGHHKTGHLEKGHLEALRIAGYRGPLNRKELNGVQSSSCLGWDTQFGLVGGPNSEVFAMAVIGRSLYVGGSFIAIGGISANRIARYDLDTGAWATLGSAGGNGVNENVTSLAVVGNSLFVGGFFTEANIGGPAVRTNRIARYDTITGTWSGIGVAGGNGVNNLVFDLVALGEDLYVGGNFTAANEGGARVPVNSLARLQTSTNSWSKVGFGDGNGVDGTVLALTLMGTDLYVGGRFLTVNVGGPIVFASNVVSFRTTASTWAPLGSSSGNGVDNEVKAFAVSNGRLYVGGSFTTAGNGSAAVVANHIAMYNPTNNNWSGLGINNGNGVNADVYSLALTGNDLVVAGDFNQANVGSSAVIANQIARFSPSTSTWSSIGGGADGKRLAGPVYRLFVVDGELLIGGNFAVVDANGTTIFANNLVKYSLGSGLWGRVVNSSGNGANSDVYSMIRIGNTVYFGGRFTSIGGISANYIAAYDLRTGNWTPLGSGGGNGVNEVVLDLAAIGTDLYVVGAFTAANTGGSSISTAYVAKYDTVTGIWSSLGSGASSGFNDSVYTVTTIGSAVYFGGGFSSLSTGNATLAVNRLARYETTTRTWSRVGTGTGNGTNEFIFALASLGTDLYLGGIFTVVNEGGTAIVANGLARFDTLRDTWGTLGSGGGNGVDEVVSSIQIIGTDLYVGGIFSNVNVGGVKVAARNIARYNTLTSSWSRLGSGGGDGVDDTGVSTMAVLGADLYVGGYFTTVNIGGQAVAANRVAKYSPATGIWTPLVDQDGGNGVDYNVYSMIGVEERLFVGGGFSTVGDGKVSSNIARYCPGSAPMISAPQLVAQQGSPARILPIATIADPDQPSGTLTVEVTPQSGTGVQLSGIAVDTNGEVKANMQVTCGATTSTFSIVVTDTFNLMTRATLTITVGANTAPVLAYGAPPPVVSGSGATISPLAIPTDNGSISSIAIHNKGSFTGSLGINGEGVLAIGNAGPVGSHNITVRATDNCGLNTDVTLRLTVSPLSINISSISPERVIAGDSSFELTVNGSGFLSGMVLRVNGENRPTVVSSPARLTATITAADIAKAGQLTLTVGDANGNSSNIRSLSVHDRVTVTTATSYAIGEISPDSIAVAFAPRLAGGVRVATNVPLPTTLLGAKITVRDSKGVVRDQPLFFVAPQQVNFLLHPETALGPATVTTSIDEEIVSLGNINIVKLSPGLFTQNSTGDGVPAAYALRVSGGNVTALVVAAYNQTQATWLPVPIDLGPPGDEIYLVLYGSGLRGVSDLSAVVASIGDKSVPVLYVGGDSNFVGLDQINLGPIPRSLIGSGLINLTVTIDGKRANPGKNLRIHIK
jgi:trimeric autotransporter adhesin